MKKSLASFSIVAVALCAGSTTALANNNASPAQPFDLNNPLIQARVAQAGAPNVLEIRTNNGQQQIEVVVGPVAGEVSVSGFETPEGLSMFTGITSIVIITGTAQDFVQVRFTSEVVPDVSINTGGGLSDLIFSYEFPYAIGTATVSNVTVTGSGSSDKVAFNMLGATSSFVGNWNVQCAGGDNEITINIDSPEASDLLGVTLNTGAAGGQDKVVANIKSFASVLNLGFTGTMGGGVDSALVFVDGLGPATTTASYNFDLGAGNDVAETTIISRGGTATMSGVLTGGNGFDNLKLLLEGDGRVDLQMTGDAGIDFLDMELKGAVQGSPRLVAGTGNDELKLVVDGPRIATPFLDGGPGFDKAIGFGTIINCEEISQ